ncbi:MAG TPA: PHP domain-containing protein [Vicinamibacterales bacterium]|nr:PHP domain-containing protein [Vicinamibacterales bacterium]
MSSRPFLLRRLSELRVIDDAREQAFVREGIVTLADLELAIAERRPIVAGSALDRAGVLIANERRPLTLGRAWDVLDSMLTTIEAHCPEVQPLQPAGGVRRVEPIVTTLSLVGRSLNPAHSLERITSLPIVGDVLHRTAGRALVVFDGYEVDIRVASGTEYGSVLFAATGPPAHAAEVLQRRGPRLSASETDVYAHAGLSYVPPEARGSADALEAAGQNTFPRLVQREDVRGDLHMHTTYSDGLDSLGRMVHAAQVLGYEYIAITDHSEHAGASRTIGADGLKRQRDEIERIRVATPGLTIFHGLEVDILPNGSLDCSDELLGSLDIVLASLHDSAGQDRAKLMRRYLGAIRHPLVNVITHPSNQLVGHRAGYDLDYAAIYAAAAETGTALEVDGAPAHLDLSGERAREAARAGVTLAVDSDCHRARLLDRQMRLGVGTARRGWVEPRSVLNTGTADDVRAFVAQKRRAS